MTIINYDKLVQAIKDEAEDDGQEFADFIPVAIQIAEKKLFRELELPELEEKETGTTTPNVAFIAKPAGYKFADYFMVTVESGSNTLLKKKTEGFLRDYWAGTGAEDTGLPKYYADESVTQFRLAPTPESNYGYEIKFTKEPAILSTTNATNYYTENCADQLFFASMLEMVRFMKAWDQLPVWEQAFTTAKDTWNVETMRQRRDSGTAPMSVSNPAPNTLRHTVNTNA